MITNRDYIGQRIRNRELMFYLDVVDNVGWQVTTPIIRNIFRCNLNVGNSIDRFIPIKDSFREYYF